MAKPAHKLSDQQRRSKARQRVLQAVYQWQITGQTVTEILEQFIQEQDLSRVDVDYFRQLFSEVVKHQAELDEKLADCLDRPLEQIDLTERAVLRIGACELIHHLEVPVKVVLNEAVELAKAFGSEQGHTYINGVLDKAAHKWRSVELG